MINEEGVPTKKPRGFAAMSPEKRREIASKGGKSVPASKRSFSNPEVAAAAGRKGGSRVPAHKRSFAANPELAQRAGILGGLAPHKNGK
jgi:general stress protein YciG